ncbi:choice-of-anchor E domain-containing protein [Duganella fentianensis]|uniref:choice-of-anchor E domain-containing protein n=1 Tax=Duganella fentianensis TaxID=2692177 RepID=UPI001E54C5A8|nr:choice-of-anchor E domain-containing protein [Duganella fentianensis]
MKKILLALATTSLFAATSAQATVISYDVSKASTVTNWTDSLSVSKFDSKLGNLNSITFQLGGSVSGAGRSESLDAAASTVTLSLSSLLTLTRPDGTTIVVTNPVFSNAYSLTAFDGAIDFAGTSGAATGAVSSSHTETKISTSASDFALFSQAGGGSLTLSLRAAGLSNASGAGNLISQFNTEAGGNLKVTYDYTAAAPVPEPETYAMLIGGLGLLGLVRRRAAKQAA